MKKNIYENLKQYKTQKLHLGTTNMDITLGPKLNKDVSLSEHSNP